MQEIDEKRKALCERSIKASGVYLALLSKQVAERSGGKPIDRRLALIVATMVRCLNSVAAIRLLWRERPYSEDMGVLVRALVEMVVNGAYIQIAAEAEVESYFKYDVLTLNKNLKFLDELRPAGVRNIDPLFREQHDKQAAETREQLKEISTATSWTKLDLHSRALAVDKVTTGNLCTILSRVVYRHGHSYIHATHRSMQNTLAAMQTGYDEDEVLAEAGQQLFAAAQTLYSLVLLSAQLIPDALASEAINEAGQALKEFSATFV